VTGDWLVTRDVSDVVGIRLVNSDVKSVVVGDWVVGCDVELLVK
jgi:hypothetical protein